MKHILLEELRERAKSSPDPAIRRFDQMNRDCGDPVGELREKGII